MCLLLAACVQRVPRLKISSGGIGTESPEPSQKPAPNHLSADLGRHRPPSVQQVGGKEVGFPATKGGTEAQQKRRHPHVARVMVED